jgi:hypothetical protein
MLVPCYGCLVPCQLAWTELFAIAGRRPPVDRTDVRGVRLEDSRCFFS